MRTRAAWRRLTCLMFVSATMLVSAIELSTAPKKGQTWSTWVTMEADKCASAWLITRFVDKEARFKFYPKGSLIKEGIPFDTPDAELRRSGRLSTYQRILDKYNLDDPSLAYVGKIVWDIECNRWGKKATSESAGVNAIIQGIMRSYPKPDQCIQKSYVVWDGLYSYHRALRKH